MNMWSSGDKLTKVPFNHKRFVCVDYPGVVKNVDNALKSVGGTENVSKVYSESNKRLSVNWRPADPFCKPAFGERCSTTNLLMKVKRRPKKGDKSKYEFQVEVLGIIDTTYKFNAMADFQYLPFNRAESGYENISHQLHLKENVDRNEFFNRDAALFLPPVIFSRFDLPDKDYLYRGEISHKPGYVNPDHSRPTHLIGTIRQKRTVYTRFVSYVDDVPASPSDEADRELHKKFFKPKQEEELKKLFETRPIWSRAALNYHFTGFKDKLKYLLPLVAFYYTNGPWRCLWTKYGYDPKKHPEAKMYQTIDYRKRQASCGDMVAIKCKRSENTLAFPALKRNAPNVPKIDLESLDINKPSGSKQKPGATTESEPVHIYRPDRLPPCRQMFYQICDIQVDEVQDLVKKGKTKNCDEKDGWCPRGTIEKCRDLMTEHTEKLIHQSGSSLEPGEYARNLRLKRIKKKKIYEEETDEEEEEDEIPDTEEEDERETNEDEQEITDINTDSILGEDLNLESMIEEDMSFMETEMLDCV
ncbi:general transcription factor 3C polypeptide 5-like [Mytilus trossulus]|uniref:general transcription factor 3C polypeptide 5-like n=1 Tax=Mytilus trossulus TaxID=6551 RepID=UPI003005CA48